MKKGDFKIKSGLIKIQVGQPISTTGYKLKSMPELIERVTATLREMLEERN